MSRATFYDDIPLMIERACRINKITKSELAERIGYACPDSITRLARGNAEGMPVGKLVSLMELAQCNYRLERN